MFEGLKTLINQDNVHKIKTNQRYLNRDQSNNHSMDSNQEHSYDDEINDRIHVFNMLTNSNETDDRYRLQRDHQRQQIKKLHKQIEMLEEKIRINQEMHQRQLQYLSEQHQLQLNTLKLQLEKYEHTIKRCVKQQGIITSLKKDVKRFMELHQQNQKTMEILTHQIKLAKKQNLQMKIAIKKKEEAQAEQLAYKYIESSTETRLKQEITAFQKEKILDSQRKKHLQQLVQRLRSEKEQLERQVDKSKVHFNHEVSIIEEKFKSQITKLEEDNLELKKRNQIIEQSFIDHLTQTSLNLQLNLKSIPERSAKNNSSLYLQASPIRTRSKDREREDNNHLSDDDPEKKDHESSKLKSQVKKLKSKLEQANEKIVQLLREKCKNQSKNSLK